MLAPYYRFRIVSKVPNTLTYSGGARVEVTYVLWKIGAISTLVYSAEVKVNTAFLNTGEYLFYQDQKEGPEIDNTTDLYIGLKGTFRVVADLENTKGKIYLYLEESTDGTVWPSDMTDFNIFKDCFELAELELDTDAVDQSRCVNFEC